MKNRARFPQFVFYLLCIFILQAACQVFTSQEKTDMVNAHNTARAGVNPPASNMGTVVWNTTLESWAQSWVNGCQNTDSNTNILDHSPSSSRPGAGENIYAASAISICNPSDAVNSWNGESAYYVYANNSCKGQPYNAYGSTWGYCGHYTQIAWANSVQLGCARGYCANIPYGYTIVCNYSPSGNYYDSASGNFYLPYATVAPGASASSTPSRSPAAGASTTPTASPGSPPSPSPSVGSSPSSSPDSATGSGGDNKSGKKNNSAMVGGIIAAVGVGVLAAGAVVAFFIYRKKKNSYTPSYYNNTSNQSSSSSPAVSTVPSSSSSPNPPNKPVVIMNTSDIQKSFMTQAPENSQQGYKPPVNSNPKPPVPSQALPKPPPVTTSPKPPVPSQPVPKPPINNSNPFPVGSQCQARYTGDGQFYKAVVKQYDPSSKQYLVSYPDYGSEEWLAVSELKK